MEGEIQNILCLPLHIVLFILFYLSLYIKALVHKSLDTLNISDICIAMDGVFHNRGSSENSLKAYLYYNGQTYESKLSASKFLIV